MNRTQYKAAGVDVDTGDALVDWLVSESSPKSFKSAHSEKIVDGIGGFASLFRFPFSHLKKPCLVTCTDGVGTKVLVAAQYQNYTGVGQDLVAMCLNDLICTGGDPLLFLDYYAVGKLDLEAAKQFLSSVKKACADSNCALVGGETAEMPGVYKPGHFDCAGFAVGVVDEEQAWGAHRVQAKDRLLGVSSSGFHSNGYSLLRKVFEADLDAWQEELLKPTALYVELVQALKTQKIEVHAAAHITGGGIENIPRVLPEHLKWAPKTWDLPEPFLEVQRRTGMSDEEMRTTLNCGVGFVLILPESSYLSAQTIVESQGFRTFDLGGVHP
ncbi:MAG: phosphoribosylformylglycinamidine cyclo-ligase [Bdellovibrio sp.]|jgi:phosphoribosylformylglycinamidine cyclo-ligase